MNNANEEYISMCEFYDYLEENTDIRFKHKFSCISRRKNTLKNFYSKKSFEEALKDGYKIDGDEVWVNKQKVIKAVEKYNESIPFIALIEAVAEHGYYCKRRTVYKKLNVYKIPIIHLVEKYISKKDYNKTIDRIEQVKKLGCIGLVDLYEELKRRNPSFIHTPNSLAKILTKEFKGRFIYMNDLGNFTGTNLYPEKIVQELIEYYEKHLYSFINLTYEQYKNITDEELEEEFRVISLIELNKMLGFGRSKFNPEVLKNKLESEKVKIIYKSNELIYVNKEWIEYVKFIKEQCVALSDIRRLSSGIDKQASKRDEKFTFINRLYIEKKYVVEIERESNLRKEVENAKTLYQYFEVRHKQLENIKKNKFIKFNDIYKKFVKSRKVKGSIKGSATFNVYELFINNMKKDFDLLDLVEIKKLTDKVLYSIEKENDRLVFLAFTTYLNKVSKINIGLYKDEKVSNTKKEYDKERFIKLLFTLTCIINDKDSRAKLYRDWHLSSAVAYTFSLFCLAWRRKDIQSKLSKPIFEFISSYQDAESLIEWFEQGNELDEMTAIKICKGIEEETERIRKETNKTKAELMCTISEEFAKDLATLLCICEANRQIHKKKTSLRGTRVQHDNMFEKESLYPTRLQLLFKKKLDIDVTEILGGDFDNIRMNKSYSNNIKEKAEELKIAFSYGVVTRARSHKVSRGKLASEMTKVYLNRDISNESLRAFAFGTMGSVLHVINKMINNEYENLSNEKKVEIIQNMNITPLEIEKNVQYIINKINAMENEIIKYFDNNGKKDELLDRLIYGKFFGITDRTKCLIKVTREKKNGITGVFSESFKNCPLGRKNCFGCDYMIAMRFFIYTLEEKLNEIIVKVEECEDYDLDLEIYSSQLKTIYLPLIEDLGEKLLGNEVGKIFDRVRYLKAVKKIDERRN